MHGFDTCFLNLPAGARVVVAMSGGVDSSVTAALLHEAGFQVIGVTLQLYDQGQVTARPGSCCAGQDVRDARAVADRLGIPHYVLDRESRFRDSVIDNFADSYIRGETPLPCVRCNQTVKFHDLLETARGLGAAALATGHYVRRTGGGQEQPQLRAGLDPQKDQSYFLFATTAEQLDFLRFPLGGMTKAETRAHAARFGLAVAGKPDSQDICFVAGGSYARLVEKLRPEGVQPGEITDLDGNVLGRHDGIIGYTVGQRKGLGIGGRGDSGEPLYVVRLEAETRRVVVGPRSALATSRIHLSEVNWLGEGPLPATPRALRVKVRSAMDAVPALLAAGDRPGHADILLETPLYGVSPGQACVFYGPGRNDTEGAQVLGGGWINRKPAAGPAHA